MAMGMRTTRVWTTKPWCESVEESGWPFAYSKYANQTTEDKGRVNSNRQDMRHECAWWGVESKCHRCELIQCQGSQHCHYQIQGVPWAGLSTNIPTVSDAPWAVNGAHRYDFGNQATTHVCLMISGGHCTSPFASDYSNCSVRCWGYGFNGSRDSPQWHYPATFYHINASNPTATDVWFYPKKDPGLGALASGAPVYNPQGYAATIAGGNGPGYLDAIGASAKFHNPQGVAVDDQGNVYVADTGNHRIRRIFPNGTVITVAGTGTAGYTDGPALQAEFSSPSSLAVWYDTIFNEVVLFVADTGNHRIRRIDGPLDGGGYVSCFSGQCGEGTSVYSETFSAAPPRPGYADGEGIVARFDTPKGIAVDFDGWVYVADTNNHLIRALNPNATTFTLAGNLEVAEKDQHGRPLPGCEPPCLKGVPGHRDGDLTYAQFYYPSGVAVGLNETVVVTDQHRVRMITKPLVVSTVQGVVSEGRVVTLAGLRHEGERDGKGQEAQFNVPQAITMSLPDGIIYVADAGSCRIRRVSPAARIAEPVNCSTLFTDVIRPSGCQSYDPPVDKRDQTIGGVFGNIHYNYWHYANMTDAVLGFEPFGRKIHDCVGSPPPDRLDKRFWNTTQGNQVVDDDRVFVKEDTGDGTIITVNCPAGCQPSTPSQANVKGTDFYSDDSSICEAAIHAGVINPGLGGMIIISLRRGVLSQNTTAGRPSLQYGVQTGQVPYEYPRVVTLSTYPEATVGVQTIAGLPAALLEEGCGQADAQPAQEAKFSMPSGLSLWINASLTDHRKLYVADSRNHRVVGISAVCSFTCENMGRCVGPDTCHCQPGWGGHDCTRPTCSTPCGNRQVCVAPNTCSCVPGYSNYPACDAPLCVQTCHNSGSCVAPDTCQCTPGWFDANCTTPVCQMTCGNGGNCTAPDQCSCPKDWTGVDCRIPVCDQTCMNGGWCTAPNTCTCPPQWSGHDCSLPVCMQGFMRPDPARELGGQSGVQAWPTYLPCSLERWCNATNGFDCRQLQRRAIPLEIPSGPFWRNVTGRAHRPPQCTYIELEEDAISPFPYEQADGSLTQYARYTPLTPYAWNATPRLPWSAFIGKAPNRTAPWHWAHDRQVALVELRNVTQGPYVCAHGGNCTAPDVCQCAPGWIGFDCRTPVCHQGYYTSSQISYVAGSGTNYELTKFRKFMGNNSQRLNWPYSNPSYVMNRERYSGSHTLIPYTTQDGGQRYQAEGGHQGGYYCSLRAWTQWENPFHLFSHPNYYSHYMDPVLQLDGHNYTFWDGMDWPGVYYKSRKLRFQFNGRWFIYTNEGWRKDGVWVPTGLGWSKGTCITEFSRQCPGDPSKALDLNSGASDVLVQDTDLSYRPRMNYSIWEASGPGRWFEEGGECVDEVVRGCFNNGTCVAPDTCRCAPGWTGFDCSIPICNQICHHNGNCTLPNRCTCERGWTGFDCSIAICAQECNNGGHCIAPDVCQCEQWPTKFRDGRMHGGRPLFRKPNGDAQNTGWTGYDCATPICVQAKRFVLNVDPSANGTTVMGGHGKDGQLACGTVRCPAYDAMVTENDGKSFQTGCGYDPWDTGCCTVSINAQGDNVYTCYKCAVGYRVGHGNNFTCLPGGDTTPTAPLELADLDPQFVVNNKAMMCGANHNPALYFKHSLSPQYWSYNDRSNYTSDRFLCNIRQWSQGDYVDSAGLDQLPAMGTDRGLDPGRYVRVNYQNITRVTQDVWVDGPLTRGEGIFECYNGGSCIAPDYCTCTDGWGGHDCNTPLCRHLQVDGTVSSCSNGGVCINRDDCHCIQTLSLLSTIHHHLERGYTGWSGTDCSMPMCIQGYFDPFCTDLPQAPGKEGCYRCANGGNCTAPDFCECAPGWTGFDCRTPTCEVVADDLTRRQLNTVDEEKVNSFEVNPCGLEGVYRPEKIGDVTFHRGNCSNPNECSCLCKEKYWMTACQTNKEHCRGPWQDPMVRHRNVLPSSGYCFGTRDCFNGYEGNLNDMDHFTSCHLKIFVPAWYIRYTRLLIVLATLFTFFGTITYNFVRRHLKRKYLLAKIERRRSRRGSDINKGGPQKARKNAFRNS